MFIGAEIAAVLIALVFLGRAMNLLILMRWYGHP
jgi:hypothetical protein